MKRTVSRRRFLSCMGAGSAAALLAACAPTPTPAPTAKPEPTKVAATQPPAATRTPEPTKGPAPLSLPIVKEPLTLTYWVEMNPNVAATLKHYGEMTCYKELEKRTGIHIEFQHPPVGTTQSREQFNLMVASRKFPDIIEFGWSAAGSVSATSGFPGGPGKAIKDGVILKLNDLIDQYAPNFKKVLDEHPEWRKQIVTDDGEIYCFPFLRSDPYLLTYTGPTVRRDWLDKTGLPMPKTVDEWHAMLVAFKGKDWNGNGKADEWPFTPARNVARAAFDSHFVIGAYGVTMGFYQDKGVAKYGPIQPEFKEFLKTVAAWYNEGLIDPDFVSTNQTIFDAKITGSQLGSAVMLTGSGIGKYAGLMASKDPNFKLVGAPYPTLKAGEKPKFGQRDFNFSGGGAAISTACKRVKEAVQLLDYAYSPEGHMLFNFGVEGVSYRLENGYPRYTELVMKNPQNLPITQAMAQHFRSCFNGPFMQDRRYMEQYAALPEQQQAITTWSQASNEGLMPPVTPTQEESSRIASIMGDVNTRIDEMLIKVITGKEPVDAWDKVVAQLKTMGIDDALKIMQGALDRYAKR